MAPPKTIPAIKTAFLNDQVRILSEPLQVPPGFDAQSTIPGKYLDHALKEVNRTYRHHIKSVYPALAIADVAQQIDRLYWDSAHPRAADSPDAPLRRTDDLTSDRNIARLGDNHASTSAHVAQTRRLKELASKRALAQQRLDKYRALQQRLAVFKDATSSVQPLLATRDGPLAEELGRTRLLATKLAGKLAGSKRAADFDDEGGRSRASFLLEDEDDRVQATLRELA